LCVPNSDCIIISDADLKIKRVFYKIFQFWKISIL